MQSLTPYPWQQTAWEKLLQQTSQNRLPHALLFTGQKGSHKTQFALNWALKLLCRANLPTACGICTDCQLWLAHTHPDFQHLFCDADATQLKVANVRTLISALRNTPLRNQARIAVISDAHYLNRAAANALLKTLEEPGTHSYLLLTATNSTLLPATIRSRCQIMALPPNPDHTPQMSAEERASQTQFWTTLQQLSEKKLSPLQFARALESIPLANWWQWWADVIMMAIRLNANLPQSEIVSDQSNWVSRSSRGIIALWLQPIAQKVAILAWFTLWDHLITVRSWEVQHVTQNSATLLCDMAGRWLTTLHQTENTI